MGQAAQGCLKIGCGHQCLSSASQTPWPLEDPAPHNVARGCTILTKAIHLQVIASIHILWHLLYIKDNNKAIATISQLGELIADLRGRTCEHCRGFSAVFFGDIVADVSGRVARSEQAFDVEGADLGTKGLIPNKMHFITPRWDI